MSNFDAAFRKVVYYEGGYVNDPDDAGGETYMGISRRAHPKSEIWNIITPISKAYKTNKEITAALKKIDKLTNLIKDIYKKSYWDKFNLDNCKSDKLAYQIFDTAVNMGVAKANTILSKVKGLKNIWEKIK